MVWVVQSDSESSDSRGSQERASGYRNVRTLTLRKCSDPIGRGKLTQNPFSQDGEIRPSEHSKKINSAYLDKINSAGPFWLA